MALFGKKKDKTASAPEENSAVLNEESKVSLLDGMFSSQSDDDISLLKSMNSPSSH